MSLIDPRTGMKVWNFQGFLGPPEFIEKGESWDFRTKITGTVVGTAVSGAGAVFLLVLLLVVVVGVVCGGVRVGSRMILDPCGMSFMFLQDIFAWFGACTATLAPGCVLVLVSVLHHRSLFMF